MKEPQPGLPPATSATWRARVGGDVPPPGTAGSTATVVPSGETASSPAGARPPGDPWGHYSKGVVPVGWSYPLGRDRVREALLDAGAFVDDLYFSTPHARLRETSPRLVLGVWHSSDARAGYYRPRGFVAPTLSMTLSAVSAVRRSSVGAELLASWLPRACAWAAQARRRGNAWSASDHSWRVVMDEEGRMVVVED